MYSIWALIAIFLISSLPVIAVYIWFRLAKYKFTIVWFLIALLIGAAAVFPAVIIQQFLSNIRLSGGRAALFFEVFVRSAFVEETCRLLLLFIFFWASSRFIKSGDTPEQPLSWGDLKKKTAAGFIAGIGFAILENAVYVISNIDIKLLLLRSITSAPVHAACGSRVGSAAAILRTNPVQAIVRLLTATAIHGIYNLMIVLPGLPAIIAILIAFTALITAIMSIKGSWEGEDAPA